MTPTNGTLGVAVSAPIGVKLGVIVGSAKAVAVSWIASTSMTGKGGNVPSTAEAAGVSVGTTLPTSVGVTTERGFGPENAPPDMGGFITLRLYDCLKPVIVAFNGKVIDDPNALRWNASIAGVGTTAVVRVARGKREFELKITLGELPTDPDNR